jgi:hypothetical protein
MTFKDPLSAPEIQIPVDYANHIIYGFILALVIALFTQYFDTTPEVGWSWGYYVTSVVAAAKKSVDYFWEHESVQMCVAKIFATIAIPLLILELIHFGLV